MIAGLAMPIGDRRRDEEHLGYVDGVGNVRDRSGRRRCLGALGKIKL